MTTYIAGIILALIFSSAVCIISGVFMLFGTGWALLSAAPCLLGIAFIFATGMRRHGV